MDKTHITIGDGLRISRIITGMWQVADLERNGSKIDPAAAADTMNAYAVAGLDTFDMADHYGSAEEITGTFRMRHPNTPSTLLTKWVPDPSAVSREATRAAVTKALVRMRTERLDLLQFHAWQYSNPNWLDCLWWLEELKKEGFIANIGVTNFDTAHLNIAVKSGITISSNQVCHSLLDRRAAVAMADFCLNQNIALLAFGTLAGGFLSERWLGKPEPNAELLDTWSQMKYKRFIDQAGGWDRYQELLALLKSIATSHGSTIAQVASKFILDTPGVSAIIIGARFGASDHLNENLRLYDIDLSDEERERIIQFTEGSPMIQGDCGDEYRKPPFLTASGDLSHHLSSLPKPFRTETDANGRLRVFTGTVWEPMAGYCRAVKDGNMVHVSGTTSTHGAKLVGGSDPSAQTHFIIDKIEGALQSAGATLEQVVRTRIFIKDTSIWEAVARAHGARFGHIMPANTMVKAEMIGEEYLVEIEADAVI
ncbi:MAG: aldo/keto reductase [Bacteroidota bacterium]